MSSSSASALFHATLFILCRAAFQKKQRERKISPAPSLIFALMFALFAWLRLEKSRPPCAAWLEKQSIIFKKVMGDNISRPSRPPPPSTAPLAEPHSALAGWVLLNQRCIKPICSSRPLLSTQPQSNLSEFQTVGSSFPLAFPFFSPSSSFSFGH